MKSKKFWMVLGVIFGLVICTMIGGATFVNYAIDSTFEKMIVTDQIEKVDVFIDESIFDLEETSKVKHVAIFGVDNRDDDYETMNSRSDAMKVLTLDEMNNRATITSLQRDMLIFIPGEINDFDKLNHAYGYGGPIFDLQTFNYIFDLGGVMVNGTALFTGIDALGFMRNCAIDSDYGRINRQSQVMMTIFDKVKLLNYNQ